MHWRKAPWLRPTAALAALWLTGCGGGPGTNRKDPVSGLWVAPANLSQVDEALLSEIAQADIRELFVPLADLDLSSGSSPLKRQPVPELPAGTRVNVVVTGELELADRDLDEVVRGVAEGVQQLFFDMESRGLPPAGVHFDLRALDSLENGRAFFRKLRGQLETAPYISLTLLPAWLEDPEMPALAKSVDYVVAFLYGQREGDADSNEAWDFEAARQRLDRLEENGLSYMMGVSGVGSATHVAKGRVKETTLEKTLSPFMGNRDLELKRGFSIQASNRRVYTLVAQQATRAGGWQIQAKDEVRLVRPMTSDVEKLLGILKQGEYPGHVGELYYRLPGPEERLSLTVENILNAQRAVAVAPELHFDIDVIRRTGRGALYRFVITSANGEPTEYAPLTNHLLISSDPNAFGTVHVGDFYRYDLLRLKPDGKTERALRNANALRLDLPILEGGERVESGDIEIRLRNPTLRLAAQFMMPDGKILDFGPFTWKDGKLQGQKDDEEGSDTDADAG